MKQEITGIGAKIRECTISSQLISGGSYPKNWPLHWDWRPGKAGTETVYESVIAGKQILLTTAGVGKVQSALTAAILLERYRTEIEAVIFTGVAGAMREGIEIGDIVVATETLEHDVDATALNKLPGYQLVRGQQPFTAEPGVASSGWLLEHAATYRPDSGKLHCGRIVSGDQFLDGSMRRRLGYFDELDALAIDMESAAVAVTAETFGIPYIAIRTISYRADDKGPENFDEFMWSVCARNSGGIVEHILSRINYN